MNAVLLKTSSCDIKKHSHTRPRVPPTNLGVGDGFKRVERPVPGGRVKASVAPVNWRCQASFTGLIRRDDDVGLCSLLQPAADPIHLREVNLLRV